MLATVTSCAVIGLEGALIRVEVDTSRVLLIVLARAHPDVRDRTLGTGLTACQVLCAGVAAEVRVPKRARRPKKSEMMLIHPALWLHCTQAGCTGR